MPTESSYAIGASPLRPDTVDRVYTIKGQREGKPILLLIADPAQLTPLVTDITPAAAILMHAFWPGPLTLVFRASPRIPPSLTAGTGTVGIRQPAVPMLIGLLYRTGPLTGTSANRSGESPARTAAEVQTALGADLDLILDGGPTPGAMPSTIVDTRRPLRLLREGPITREQLQAALAGSGLALTS
jgi:L-threonylcarbamoyladenylate synthase